MPRIRITHYSNFYDPKTRVQFTPVLDRRSGVHVGIAEVDRKTAKAYEGRDGFDVVGNEEWLSMTSMPEDPEPDEPNTGDPLADAGQVPTPKPLSELSHAELVTLAKEHDVRHVGVSRDHLIAALEAKLAPANDEQNPPQNPADGPPPPPPSA